MYSSGNKFSYESYLKANLDEVLLVQAECWKVICGLKFLVLLLKSTVV